MINISNPKPQENLKVGYDITFGESKLLVASITLLPAKDLKSDAIYKVLLYNKTGHVVDKIYFCMDEWDSIIDFVIMYVSDSFNYT